MLIARTDTLEKDGFEIYFAPEHSEKCGPTSGSRHGARLIALPAWERETPCVWKRLCACMARNRRHHDAVGGQAWADLQAGKGEFLGREILIRRNRRRRGTNSRRFEMQIG